MTRRDVPTGDGLPDYAEDTPCPHCGRTGAEALYLTGPEWGRARMTDVYPHIQRRCWHCGAMWAERVGEGVKDGH
jgi:hypothetical protein